MALYLVRHGETRWTLERRHTGRTDLPLTEGGEEQARQLRERLRAIDFRRTLSSPRQRALVTAELAGAAGEIEVAPLLAEFDYGEYEGLTTGEIRSSRPDWDLWRDGCPGGESAGEVMARGARLLSELDPGGAGDLLLFGHGHALRALAAAYLGYDAELCRHLVLRVASISVLGEEHGCPTIEAWDLT